MLVVFAVLAFIFGATPSLPARWSELSPDHASFA